MSDKYVKVPEEIVVVNPITGEPMQRSDRDSSVDDPWTMHRFLVVYVARDPSFKNADDSRCVRRLLRAFKDAKPGDEVKLQVSDWRKANDVLDNPGIPFNAVVTHQLIDFMDAWAGATDKPRAELG